jgi:NhaA family Na+:H+ antiporter
MLGAGALGGIGFTMSIFVASIAFRGHEQIDQAKAAIIFASVLAGAIGYFVLRAASSPES